MFYMVANQKIVAAINEQMGNEFSAMLQYYAIAAHFGAEGLRELSAHFYKQAEEEKEHALRFIQFVIDTGARVKIPAVSAPQAHFEVAETAVKLSLEQEEQVTTQINALVAMAIRPTISFSGSLRSSWRRSPRWDSCCGLFSVPARAICCAWRNIWHERGTAGALSARKNDRFDKGGSVATLQEWSDLSVPSVRVWPARPTTPPSRGGSNVTPQKFSADCDRGSDHPTTVGEWTLTYIFCRLNVPQPRLSASSPKRGANCPHPRSHQSQTHLRSFWGVLAYAGKNEYSTRIRFAFKSNPEKR
jgi:bacterioferritin (cytochrome b1)